ncbi:MAG: IscS subfamily cysteine desulfurase [Flavisolibacter sp.]
MQKPVYFDHNATTPCDPRVLETMLPYFSQKFGNAASRHHFYGWQAEEAVEHARRQVASLIGAESREIVFTSGATEAINLALKGVYEIYHPKGVHIITTNIEHKAVLDTLQHLEKQGAHVTRLPVNREGLVSAAAVEAAIRPDTILICVMYANNETGSIMPVREIGAVAKKHNVLFFSDSTQAVGKIPVDVQADGIDLLSLSAHKFYGPKGSGALYLRRRDPRVRLAAQMHGGGHENGLRSGTLNVPAIVGLGAACELAAAEMTKDAERLAPLRDKLEEALLQVPESRVNGSRQHRLPQVTNLAFAYLDSEALMSGLKTEVALSSGSACTSASIEPSYVLKALGLSDEMAHGSLRFSLGRFTTAEEVEFVTEVVKRKVDELRAENPLWQMHLKGIDLGA